MRRPTIADWLDALRREGEVTVDPDLAIDVERLLAVWAGDGGVTVEVAANAIAARVATSAEQYRAVRRSFLEAFGEEAGRGGAGGAREPGTQEADGGGESTGGKSRRRWWIGLIGLAVTGAGWWWSGREPPVPPTTDGSPTRELGLEPRSTSHASGGSDEGASSTSGSNDGSSSSTSGSNDGSSSSTSGNSKDGSSSTSNSNDAGSLSTNGNSKDGSSSTSRSNDGTSSARKGEGPVVVLVEPEREVPFDDPPWSVTAVLSLLGSGLVSALLVILGLRWLRARVLRDLLVEHGRAARRQAVDDDGPKEGELYRFKTPAPLDPTAIDAAADLLGRPAHDEVGTRLDVPRTVDRTLRAGGQPRPRFLRATRQPPLVVLVDVEVWGREGRAHPLAHAVEWILERWQRTGLRFERFDYVGSVPSEVRRPGSTRAISLNALARRHGGARLLVWSRLRMLRDDRLSAWLIALRPWERRTWIDLDPRPAVPVAESDDGREAAALERIAEVERAGLCRYPLTRQGLVAAARHVVAERGRPPAVTDEVVLRKGDAAQRVRIERALAQWAAAACCVPDPAWAHLDVLRTLLPDVRREIPETRGVWWLLQWLEREGCMEGEASGASYKLALRSGAETRLLRDKLPVVVEGRTSTVEQWITQRLVQQLHDGQAARSGATRRIDDEERRARLAYYQCGTNLESGVETLMGLLGTTADSLVRELLRRLEHQIEIGAALGGKAKVRKTAHASVSAALGKHVRVGEVLGRPRRWEVATVAGVLTVTVVVRQDQESSVRVEPPVYEVQLPQVEEVRSPDVPADPEPTPQPDVPAEPTPEPLPEEETVALELPQGAKPMRLRRIEAGEFWMGSTEKEAGHEPNEQQHRVILTHEFQICETEVTQAQWVAVMGKHRSRCEFGCGDDIPVHDVSWEMAVEYLNALSEREQLEQCYEKVDGRWQWEPNCDGYRLPTEAEWEYAARAGTTTAYAFGDDTKALSEHAWHADNSSRMAHPVAEKPANQEGLHDAHGNVREWVWDRYTSDYGTQTRTDPAGPTKGESRVLRGGSFLLDAERLRSADRDWGVPRIGDMDFGLRCARGPHPRATDAP